MTDEVQTEDVGEPQTIDEVREQLGIKTMGLEDDFRDEDQAEAYDEEGDEEEVVVDPEDSEPDFDPETEGQEEDEEGDEEEPIVLGEEVMSAPVQLPNGDVVTMRELYAGFEHRVDRRQWTKHRQQVDTLTKQLEAERGRIGKLADTMDAPHIFLDVYLKEALKSGAITKDMYQGIDRVFADAIQKGRYSPAEIQQRMEQKQQYQSFQQKQSELAEREAMIEAKAQVQEIESKYGRLSSADKEKIGDLIDLHYQKTGGEEVMSISDAFNQLLNKKGGIQKKAVAKASKRKLANELRKKGGVTTTKKRGKSDAVTKDEAAERLWKHFHGTNFTQ